jgi:hypothetical protein
MERVQAAMTTRNLESMKKQRGMAFGFRKSATAVKKYRIERFRETKGIKTIRHKCKIKKKPA